MAKRDAEDYTVEKTIETMKILEALEYEPANIKAIIRRIGYIPALERNIKPDAVRRVLITLKILGYARHDEHSKNWSKGFRKF